MNNLTPEKFNKTINRTEIIFKQINIANFRNIDF